MIEVKNLKKTFINNNQKLSAVDGISFKVDKGEIFGIIGLSGAGKSTLIRLLNRLENPDEGQILIDGEDITKLSYKKLLEKRKSIGMIFQHFNLFNQKNVYQNIKYPLTLINYDKDKIEERVDELLNFVGLEDKKYSYPSQLSGGQKQRVAIARALATNPKVILSDEATSALDPQNTQQILELLRKSVKEYQTTVIMITHQMEVAKDVCDTIAVMEKGKIIEENKVEELFKNPKTKITKNFIRNINEKEDIEEIISEDFKGRIFRFTYSESSYNKPILSEIAKKSDISFNIISGNINKLQSTGIGYTNLELIGEDEEIERIINIVKNSGILVEEIK